MKWETKHFSKLDNATGGAIRDYYYLYEYWINHNIGPSKTCSTVILKVVEANANDKWTIE